MTTYNTGNALGSGAAKDIYDNAQNLDVAVNDKTSKTWTDRLGVLRKTFHGMEEDALAQLSEQQVRFAEFIQSSGYEVIGDYTAGPLTITEYNQLIRYENEFYKLKASASIPFTTTGIDSSSWTTDSANFVSVGDAALRQELASSSDGEGLYLVKFKQSGSNAVERDAMSKARDLLTPKDYGAVGDGENDDTSAMLLALASVSSDVKIYLPDGDYLSDTTQFDWQRFFGPGKIKGTNGSFISLNPISSVPGIVQKKMMEPFFGFSGSTDTQIYTNARNALQGIAYCIVDGVEKLFVSQRPSGSAWADGEQIRLLEFNLAEDGSVVNNIAYTDVLNLGHGFDLSAVVEGGDVYLYTSLPTQSGAGGTAAGKGFSKIKWNGADTAQTDVSSYQLFGSSGSGHVFQNYGRAGVGVSSDGKYVILVTTPSDSDAAKRAVFVYDREEVESASDPTAVMPKYKWVMTDTSSESAYSVQGVASDGKLIHILKGGGNAFGQHYILTYDMTGTLVRTVQVDDARSQYGYSGLMNNSSLGNPARFEPEGITIRGDQLLISCIETWRSGATVVSWKGKNWAACSLETTGITGVPPSNGTYWVETTKSASAAWDATVDYGNGSAYTLEKKTIYAIMPSVGGSDEEAVNSGMLNPTSNAEVDTGESGRNLSFRWRNAFNIVAFSQRLNSYFSALMYDTASRLRIYDQQYANDNTVYASIQAMFSSAFKGMILRGRGTSAANSAYLRLHSSDDPTYPNSLIEGTKTDGTFSRETTQYGETRLSASSGYTPLTLLRVDDGQLISFEKVKGTNLGGLYRTTTSPEGNLTAPYGSLCIYISGTTATLYFKQSGTGNTGWVAK